MSPQSSETSVQQSITPANVRECDFDPDHLYHDHREANQLRDVLEEIAFGLQDHLEEHGDCERGDAVSILRQVREALTRAEGRQP